MAFSIEPSAIGSVEEQRDQLSMLFKALVHPARVSILDALRNGEQCVCHLESHLGYRQAYISQQLAILRSAGLIQDTRDGLNIYYRVIRPEIFALIDGARRMTGTSNALRVENTLQIACPCPKCAMKYDSRRK